MIVLIALLYFLHLHIALPRPAAEENFARNSAQRIQLHTCYDQPVNTLRRYLLCWFDLPTKLVIHERITQFLYHINYFNTWNCI